jgi:hypothetical protein
LASYNIIDTSLPKPITSKITGEKVSPVNRGRSIEGLIWIEVSTVKAHLRNTY